VSVGDDVTTAEGGAVFEYAPAPESRAMVRLQSSYGLFVDGEFRDPIDGTTFKLTTATTNKSTRSIRRSERLRCVLSVVSTMAQ